MFLISPPALGTDPSTGQVLLLSTQPQPETACLGESPARDCPPPPEEFRVWSWNGSAWTTLSDPAPRGGSGFYPGTQLIVADPISGHLALFRANTFVVCGAISAGAASPVPCPLNAAAATGSVPPPAVSPAMVPCCYGNEIVWNGAGWSQPVTFNAGPTIPAAMLAGDPAHHDVLAFSPQGTFRWTGSGWTALHPSRTPAPVLSGATLVYDGASQRVLLFGGEVLGGKTLTPEMSGALYAWDGSTWTQVSGAAPEPVPTPTVSLLPAPASPPAAPASPPSLPSPELSPPVVNPGGPCIPPPGAPNKVCAGSVGIPPPG